MYCIIFSSLVNYWDSIHYQDIFRATIVIVNFYYRNSSALTGYGHTNKLIYLHTYMWPALPKPATYIHHVKEHFSLSMDSSINKLTNCQYTTAKCWQVCFCWGLFLRPVRRPWVLGCPLNATGWLVQAATLLEITIRYKSPTI